MDKQIEKLKNIIGEENAKLAVKWLSGIDNTQVAQNAAEMYLKLIPESEFNLVEQKFKKRVVKNYQKTKKTLDENSLDVDTYLEKKLNQYDNEVNQMVAYFKKGGGVARYVQVSSYLSMLHNTNLTRAGWNQTLMDANKLGANRFVIPYHPFSCQHCREWQGIPLSLQEVYDKFGVEEETEGDILHPNCKCTLSILWDVSQLDPIRENTLKYSAEENEEQYEIRQKVNGATLQREKLEVDRSIASAMGNEKLVDKYDKKINTINKRITKLVNSLPTKALKKQVEAINR